MYAKFVCPMKDYSVLIFCFSNFNFLEVVKLSLIKVLLK